MTKDGKIKTKARGLDRAFAILDYLCQTGLSQRPIEIAEGMGAPKSSIYDLVALLVASNVLQKVDGDGRIFLGPKLNFWSINYRKHFDLGETVRQAFEHITSCARETSQLCTLDGDKYYVAMMNEGIRPFRISADIGERIPVPWTASGRFLLAHLSDGEILDFIPAADFNLPDGSRLEPEAFLHSVRAAQKEKFFDFDSVSDNFTHCFAAPAFTPDGVCRYTLCIIAPKDDSRTNYEEYKNVLKDASEKLSARFSSGRQFLKGLAVK